MDDEWKMPKVSAKTGAKIYRAAVLILLVAMLVGLVVLFVQVHQVNSRLDDINMNLPQSSCDATVGENTIICNQ